MAFFNDPVPAVNTSPLITFWEIFIFIIATFTLSAFVYRFLYKRREKLQDENNRLRITLETLESPDKFNDLKDRISSVISLRERRAKRERFFIITGTVTLAASILIIILKISKCIDDEIPIIKQDTLAHFDVTGIALGVAGIIVGIVIFIVVENDTEIKNIAFEYHFEKLKDVTDNILTRSAELTNVTNDILKFSAELEENKTLSNRLMAINNVIQHAKETHNDLYILSYDPVYGQFQMANLEILLQEKSTYRDDIKKTMDTLIQPIKSISELKEKNKSDLIDFIENGGKLNMAVLKDDWSDTAEPKKFTKFIEDHIVKDTSIIHFIDENSKNHPPLNDIIPHTYILFKSKSDTNPHLSAGLSAEGKKSSLITNLINEDKVFLKELQKNKPNLILLDYIPFQFFLSIPSPKDTNPSYSSTVVFTNYYNLGQENGVISYNSKSERLTLGLKKMFDGLLEDQKERNAKPKPIKQLFTIGSFAQITVLLKTILYDNHLQCTPKTDILAKDNLIKMFHDNEIDFSPEAHFLQAGTTSCKVAENFSPMSVGLFTDFLYKPHNLLKVNRGDGCTISVAKSGYLSSIGDDNYETFTPSYQDQRPVVDYAVFSKQYNDKSEKSGFFIFGGIHSLGTERISQCLTKDNCEIILNHAGENKQFIAVFEVNASDITQKLHSLSIVERNGLVTKINL